MCPAGSRAGMVTTALEATRPTGNEGERQGIGRSLVQQCGAVQGSLKKAANLVTASCGGGNEGGEQAGPAGVGSAAQERRGLAGAEGGCIEGIGERLGEGRRCE